jgi:cytochrome c-type biogenesis protein CcmH/NrfF
MTRSRKAAIALTSAYVALGLAVSFHAPLHAQSSTSPAHMGYDPNAVIGGHFHDGELGEVGLLIERNIRCNCGCNLDVHSCQFQMQCGVSPGWSERIRQSLQAGETREAIEASFVADFGRTVLMTPPAEGFNLVGYFLPAVAIVTAGMFIGLLVRRGAGYRPGLAPVTDVDDEDAERLRTAMQKLDETEGPDW